MWAQSNMLVLNWSKTKKACIWFEFQTQTQSSVKSELQGVPVEQVEEANLLGVLLDGRLNWSEKKIKLLRLWLEFWQLLRSLHHNN